MSDLIEVSILKFASALGWHSLFCQIYMKKMQLHKYMRLGEK